MLDDLSILDDSKEEQIAAFRKFQAGCLIQGSSLDGDIALIPAKSFANFFPGATCYLPHEIHFLLALNDGAATALHLMKRRSGSFLEIKQEDKKCSETGSEETSKPVSPLQFTMLD